MQDSTKQEIPKEINSPKEPWYKVINSLAISGSLIAIPIILALLGNQHTNSENEIKQRAEYVKMGLSILQAKPTGDNKSLRKWAVDIINNYSKIKMEPEVESDLINKVTLPIFSNVFSDFEGELKTEHYFSWVGDKESAYYLEIQENNIGNWDTTSWGISVKGTGISMEVPVNKKLRWRASKYRDDAKIEYANWLQLYIEKSL